MFNIKISLAIRKLLERMSRNCGSIPWKQTTERKRRREMKTVFFVFELILQPGHDIPNIWLIGILGSIS